MGSDPDGGAGDNPDDDPGGNPADSPDGGPGARPADNPGGNPADSPDGGPGARPADNPGGNPADSPDARPDDGPGARPRAGGAPAPGAGPRTPGSARESGAPAGPAPVVAEAAARLQRIPPEDFVAERDALVADARAAGDRAAAKEIASFKRPTRAAWLTNLLVAEVPDEVDGLLGLAGPLAEAQQSLDGAALRRVSAQRSTLVGSLARRAAQLGRETGRRIEPALEREVRVVLESALADEELAERVRSGRLVRFERHSGFGPLAASSGQDGPQTSGSHTTPDQPPESGTPDRPTASRSRRATPDRPAASGSRATPDQPSSGEPGALRRQERAQAERARRETAVADAEALLEQARLAVHDAARERDDARERADAAATRRDDAHRRVEDLRAELDRARSAVTAAEREARSAERAAGDADRRARSSTAAVARAEQAVEDARES
ncbi:hypothetical protein [Pseudonocardia sp. NPDC046786]|uniref:hypothetical protein n=1 Tax=Pseudonocardia sp. NPDC046786 TaxID=3155471 RepID=UPI0033D501E8